MTVIMRAQGLGKRYGRRWALADCTMEVPAGRVCDYLIVLVASRIRLAGDVTELMAAHRPGSLEELVLAHMSGAAAEVRR